MLNEITAAVRFLVQLIEKNEKFSPDQVTCFQRCLMELLTERFKNHWFPDKPSKGQGFRCIRVNGNSRRDSSLESAASAAGVRYEDLSIHLPIELTLWVDPREVCCRFGETKGSYCTLASFDDKENVPKTTRENYVEVQKEKVNERSPPRPVTPDSRNQFNKVDKLKPRPLGTTNQNHNVQTKRRNSQSPRSHPNNRNRTQPWFTQPFNMNFRPPPMKQVWYNVMPAHYIGGPSPPPYVSHRGTKWLHPSLSHAGPGHFQLWSPKHALLA